MGATHSWPSRRSAHPPGVSLQWLGSSRAEPRAKCSEPPDAPHFGHITRLWLALLRSVSAMACGAP